MKIEHLALQVEDPVSMCNWYLENLGFTVVRASDEPRPVRFIADESGHTLLEIYHNSAVSVPDYRGMDPLHLHIAFVSTDIDADILGLCAAGATVAAGPDTTDAGDRLAMLRDPWGVVIQLCQRANPMF